MFRNNQSHLPRRLTALGMAAGLSLGVLLAANPVQAAGPTVTAADAQTETKKSKKKIQKKPAAKLTVIPRLDKSKLGKKIHLPVPSYTAEVADNVLTVRSGPDDANLKFVSEGADVVVRDLATGSVRTYRAIEKVVYVGWVGDDTINGTYLTVPLDARGGVGDDRLWGGSAHDRLRGQAGEDRLYGQDGRDTLIGGADSDYLMGSGGDDWLIAIDNDTTDEVRGGSGRDSFWVDRDGGRTDSSPDDGPTEVVHAVQRFVVGDKTLNGDDLWDPQIPGDINANYVSYADRPLWNDAMAPTGADIFQGNMNDCKVVAALSSIAHNTNSGDAWPIRSSIADFGDGTYGVALGDNFYRVDADLPQLGNGNLPLARLGSDNSLWVAIAEKALAHHDSRAVGLRGTYDRLRRTSSVAVFRAFGSPDGDTPLTDDYANSAADLGRQLFNQWNRFGNTTLSLQGTLNSTGRGHAYTVWEVQRAADPADNRIILRNPWGRDGNGSNAGIDGNDDDDLNDGFVTYTAQQIWDDNPAISRVNWADPIN